LRSNNEFVIEEEEGSHDQGHCQKVLFGAVDYSGNLTVTDRRHTPSGSGGALEQDSQLASRLRKNSVDANIWLECSVRCECQNNFRMLKKAVQQGRSEQRGESYSGPYVEPLSDARTPLADFFSILLEQRPRPPSAREKRVRIAEVAGEQLLCFVSEVKWFLVSSTG